RRCRKRSHLAEQGQGAVPGREQVPRAWAQRLREMLLHEGQELPFVLRLERTDRDHVRVEPGGETGRLVEHVGDAVGHARAEVAPDLPSTTTVPPVMYSQQWLPAPS